MASASFHHLTQLQCCPSRESDEWTEPLHTVLRGLQYNVRELLFTDWHLASGNYDWRDELLEQLKPPDPIEVEGTATIEEADGEAYWVSLQVAGRSPMACYINSRLVSPPL